MGTLPLRRETMRSRVALTAANSTPIHRKIRDFYLTMRRIQTTITA